MVPKLLFLGLKIVIVHTIANVVLRGRFFRFVFNTDIEKMYRQIRIDPPQQSLQRILFRESENSLVWNYELSTVYCQLHAMSDNKDFTSTGR